MIRSTKAPQSRNRLFTALKHCDTPKRIRAKRVISALILSLLAFAVLGCGLVWAQNSDPVSERGFELGSDPEPKADAIYIHANVYTGIERTNSILRAEAIAVRADRIQAVGKNVNVKKLKGPQTQVIDLGGHFVMPGFNDAHMHLAMAGLQSLNVDLIGVKTLDEFRARLRAKAEAAKPGDWILGGGWDETLWPLKTLPSRRALDEVSGDHPVFLDRVDGHLAVANTRALQLAGVTPASRDPQGGKIDRDENGQTTGILRDAAKAAVQAVIPATTHGKRRRGIETALADLAAHGVTSAQDYSPEWENFQIYEELEKEGRLTSRISEWLPFTDSIEELRKKRAAHSQSDLMLHTGMLKAFMDGSLGGRTAALLESYADDPHNSGLLQYDAAKLNEMARERVQAGFQLGFHAIGDRAIQMALEAFAEAENFGIEKNPYRSDFRLRVEHAQVVTPAEIARFCDLKIIASMQPSQLLTDMRWTRDRLGPTGAAESHRWGSFLNRGVTLAFGTDYPVEPVTPFRGLYAAVTRKSEDGKQEFFPDQKITLDQAIAAYTEGSAFAEFEEQEKGKLAPGMLADFVVLDRDITTVAPERILGTRVLRTVVGGKTVYEAK